MLNTITLALLAALGLEQAREELVQLAAGLGLGCLGLGAALARRLWHCHVVDHGAHAVRVEHLLVIIRKNEVGKYTR